MFKLKHLYDFNPSFFRNLTFYNLQISFSRFSFITVEMKTFIRIHEITFVQLGFI